MIDSTNPRIIADNIKKLWEKVNGIVPGTVVEGNPSGSGFNTLLTKIKIGSSKYKLPPNVEANPEGEASGSLSKIGIGSGVYSIAGGSITPLAAYSGEDVGYAANDEITLSQAMTNFDMLMFTVRYSKTEGLPNGFVSVDALKNVYTTRAYVCQAGSIFADVVYMTDTKIKALRTTYAYITGVYGIKF